MLTGLGKYHQLEVIRASPNGVYLRFEEQEILLPNKYCSGINIGDNVDVFLYKDSEDRPVATTEKPLATLGDYALMEVVAEASFGVFVDMGLEKHLLVPSSEMVQDMQIGKKYLIRLMADFRTERLIGVAKIEGFSEVPTEIEENQALTGIVYQKTDLGFKVWTDLNFIGLLYHSELFTPIGINETVTCYVNKIRHDGKVDLRLSEGGLATINQDADKILAYFKEHGGSIHFTDQSSPEEIQSTFGISKKAFKRAVGVLYKAKKINLINGAIQLHSE